MEQSIARAVRENEVWRFDSGLDSQLSPEEQDDFDGTLILPARGRRTSSARFRVSRDWLRLVPGRTDWLASTLSAPKVDESLHPHWGGTDRRRRLTGPPATGERCTLTAASHPSQILQPL
ncbi:hypothetical protein SKAU_G00394610 [Synaphobranchus kaupii]|uniref:Uncharacterized protein n=1 Tax=Synaphobranchus kaupii TaxID=118154 RepID=A0A9Q1IBX8_SYNKA|nr:hypothetical protein SKAU_G00394610 [Synaphobranchus kaupii]